ncbi:hypothetical protein [Pseudomonas serbica]|uniref:hypothetical protein n=1 Tax=Pseudomonas serbica TaxID=2965074 RepID=UPI00237BF553|nr:hypothetical protein [Pseudomonas serbica]
MKTFLTLSQYGSTFDWVIACVGLSMMCLGFWLAGYRFLTVVVSILMAGSVFQLLFGMDTLIWESGWMWYDWRVPLTMLMVGSLISLVITAFIVRDMLVAKRKNAEIEACAEKPDQEPDQ